MHEDFDLLLSCRIFDIEAVLVIYAPRQLLRLTRFDALVCL